LKSIGSEAFRGGGLNKLTITDGLKSIGWGAFYGCSVEEVVIPDSVETIDGHAFYYSKLKHVTIGKGAKSIADDAFYWSSDIVRIDVDEDNKYYSSEDGVLFNHDKTILLMYPSANATTSYTIPDTVVSIEHDAFFRATNLQTVKFGKNVRTINGHAFEYCDGLTEVVLPEKLEVIGSYAFASCNGLTEISIPDNVLTFGDSAFQYCSSIQKVLIGESIIFIGAYAFSGCTSLSNVFYQSPTVVVSFNLFSDDSDVVVCVPPYYNSNKFGNAQVSKSSVCDKFQAKFDHCHTGIPDGKGGFTKKWKNNATNWELKANDCAGYQCHDELGYLSWNMCNSTDSKPMICVKKQCIDTKDYSPDIYVQAELEDDVDIGEIDDDEIHDLMFGFGAETDEFGYEGNRNGDALRMMFGATDEEDAKNAANAAQKLKDEKEGVFSKVRRIQIVGWHDLESGSTLSVSTATILLFVVMLVLML